jgi:hypothetical protein
VDAVGATNAFGERASFSQYGIGLKFVAPGQSIVTTDRTGSSRPHQRRRQRRQRRLPQHLQRPRRQPRRQQRQQRRPLAQPSQPIWQRTSQVFLLHSMGQSIRVGRPRRSISSGHDNQLRAHHRCAD